MSHDILDQSESLLFQAVGKSKLIDNYDVILSIVTCLHSLNSRVSTYSHLSLEKAPYRLRKLDFSADYCCNILLFSTILSAVCLLRYCCDMSAHASVGPDEASLAQSLNNVDINSTARAGPSTVPGKNTPSTSTIVVPDSEKKRKNRSNDSLEENTTVEEAKGGSPAIRKDVKTRRKLIVAKVSNNNKGNNAATKRDNQTDPPRAQSNRATSASRGPIVNNGNNKKQNVKAKKSLKAYFKPKTPQRAVAIAESAKNTTIKVTMKGNTMSDNELDLEGGEEAMDQDGIIPLDDEGKALFK